MPLSNDLRKCIIEDYLTGAEVKTIVKELRVSSSAAYKLLALYKEIGDYKPRPSNAGRKPVLSEKQMEELKAIILEKPDITLQEILDEMGLDISRSALCVIIKHKLKFTRKKKLFSQENRQDPMCLTKEQSGKKNMAV